MHTLYRLIMGISVLFAVALPTAAQGEGDYGDAPETYANAFHSVIGQEWLGGAGAPSVTAEASSNRVDQDALDDGLASDGSVQVTIAPDAPAGTRYLNAWIDLNDDGTWLSADEYAVANATVEQAPGTTASYSFPILGENFGVHWIRVTLTRAPLNSTNGAVSAEFGETEDYPGGSRIRFTPTPTRTPTPTPTVYDPVPPSPEPTDVAPPTVEPKDMTPSTRTPEEQCGGIVKTWEAFLTDVQAFLATLADLRAALDFSLTYSHYAGTISAMLDYLNTVPDPNASVSAADIDALRNIAYETCMEDGGQPDQSPTPEAGAQEFVSGRNRYTINAPAPVREMNAYDELPLEGGSIFIQALPANQAVGIGEALDCAAYGDDYFTRNNLRTDDQFAQRVLNGIPMCAYLIVGNGFYQYEMAFWNHGLPMGMSIFSRDLGSFVRLFAFLLFGSNFGLVEPPPFTGCTATALQNANLRQGPGTGFGRAGAAAAGDVFDALLRDRTAEWVAIAHDGQTVWIAGFLVETDCAVETLPIADE